LFVPGWQTTSCCALERLRPEWEELFYASGTTNPFLHPAWQLTWCDHFVAPEDVVVVVVRHHERLVCVAPFYRRHLGGPGSAGSTHLRAFGAGRHGELIETPGILVDPGCKRAAFRALTTHLLARERRWDWVEFPFGFDQGWFEPQWVEGEGGGRAPTVIHKGTKPCVVMPLADDWEKTVAGLKRNVRQSIHRGHNRLSRASLPWQFEVVEAGGFPDFLATLTRLHSARSSLTGKVRHPDVLADVQTRSFLEAVGSAVGGDDLIPCLLRADGDVVAARLMLRAGDTVYLSVSGFDPMFWDQGVATTLLAECLRFAIGQGARSANLSTGIDVSKLRWSEDIQRNEDFVVVAPRTRSRVAFSLYWQLRSDRIRFAG